MRGDTVWILEKNPVFINFCIVLCHGLLFNANRPIFVEQLVEILARRIYKEID